MIHQITPTLYEVLAELPNDVAAWLSQYPADAEAVVDIVFTGMGFEANPDTLTSRAATELFASLSVDYHRTPCPDCGHRSLEFKLYHRTHPAIYRTFVFCDRCDFSREVPFAEPADLDAHSPRMRSTYVERTPVAAG